MSTKSKLIIPNVLTISRIILTPIIIVLGMTKNYKIALLLIIIASITDLFDGKLARKWNTVTDIGTKLDTIADKIFAIGLIACLISNIKLFVLLLAFEIVIGLFNLYSYFKTNHVKSLMIGKIKTTFLFITVIVGFSVVFFGMFKTIINGFIICTLNIQILALISYIIYYYDISKNKEIEEAIVQDKDDTRTKIYDIEDDDEESQGNTKVLNHLKDIFFDE